MNDQMILQILPVVATLVTMTSAYPFIVKPVITLLYPQGIRFEIADQPGLTLVAIHYSIYLSINTQLAGVAGGQYNYDITFKTGGVWVHENHNVFIQIGFTVSYWVYETVYGQPYQLLNQVWTAAARTTTSSSTSTSSPSTTTTLLAPTTTITTTTTPTTTATKKHTTATTSSATTKIPSTNSYQSACLSNPCLFGTCQNMNNGFHCLCFAGYTGKQCSQDVDECCPINPCKTGACIDQVNGVLCSCPNGIHGSLCDVCENNHPNCTAHTTKLRDCKDVFDAGRGRVDGVYTIDLFGKASVRCDMTSEDGAIGGWTVIMYRNNVRLDFKNKLFVDYAFGFGNKMYSFWEGLDTVHMLTPDGRRYQLRIDLTAANGSHNFALYGDFRIGPARDFTIHVGKYSGTAGDSLTRHNGLGFTTPDHDVDSNPSKNCAKVLGGSWWFHDCCDSCLTCPYMFAFSGTQNCSSMSWNSVRYCEPLRMAKMMIRPL